MKCQNCDGNGRFEVEDNGVVMQGVYWRCPNCGGKGVVEPMTNEEWLKQCTTEQLAEFLADKCNEVVETVLSDASCDIGDIDNDDYWYRQADFVEWLKEKHNDSVQG